VNPTDSLPGPTDRGYPEEPEPHLHVVEGDAAQTWEAIYAENVVVIYRFV